jgi:endoglucanase
LPFKNIHFALVFGLAMLFFSFAPQGLSAVETTQASMATVTALEDTPSMAVVRRMGLGWNLGNTLEACGDWIKGGEVRNYETAWGNPETTKEIIDAVKASGFKSVRIPVGWSNLMGKDYAIDPRLMERVKQVVDMVLADDMIAVVNIHWDGGWWSKFSTEPEESMKRYKTMWSQIAGNFKDYPGTLIFESLNEEGCFNDVWNRYGGGNSGSKAKAYGILNDINQNFVDLVRGSGGLNAKRHLLIAGYATDIDLTVDPDFLMPTDPAKHLIVSVHYYTPYTFTGLEKDESWGKMRTTWGTAMDLAELDTNMQKLQTRFLNEGIPVIVGEYGASTKKDPESVRLYTLTVAEKVYKMGMCPMLWDAGGYLDRRKLQFFEPKILDGFQKIVGEHGVYGGQAEPTPVLPSTTNRYLLRK